MTHTIAMCYAGRPAACPCCHGTGRLESIDENLAGAARVDVCTHCMGSGQVLRDEPRIGEAIISFLGGWIYLEDPRPGDFDVITIAVGLSRLCRFAGQPRRFVSVAEHSVLCARHAPAGLQLTALMHDASEAFLGDVPRPLKRLLPVYVDIEQRMNAAIAAQYGLLHPWPPEIKRIDNAMLAAEVAQNMAPSAYQWPDVEPLDVRLEYWDSERAREEFLRAFAQYEGA